LEKTLRREENGDQEEKRWRDSQQVTQMGVGKRKGKKVKTVKPKKKKVKKNKVWGNFNPAKTFEGQEIGERNKQKRSTRSQDSPGGKGISVGGRDV